MLKIAPIDSDIVVRPFESRIIRCCFHDIDGTHSLIRNWPPVMSAVLHYAEISGVPAGYDSEENEIRIAALCGTKPLPETDAFCVESAGLSALTQMEWALRRAVEKNTVQVPCNRAENAEKIRRIGLGEEVFPDLPDSPEMEAFLSVHTPRLFKFYEKVLNRFCRDNNLEQAKRDPARFRVPGSPEFLRYLHENGVKNYFVTGAVVEKGMGMHEEVLTLGYAIGDGEIVDDIIGSTWDEKIPKDVIMEKLAKKLGLRRDEILVVGDGRSEISAGAGMGAVMISRLPADADYQRQLHKQLGTNIIIENYLNPDLYKLFTPCD